MAKQKQMLIRVAESTHGKLKELAQQEEVSVTYLVRRAIRRYIEGVVHDTNGDGSCTTDVTRHS